MRPISSDISRINRNKAVNQVYYDYSHNKTMKINNINIINDGELFSLFYAVQSVFLTSISMTLGRWSIHLEYYLLKIAS